MLFISTAKVFLLKETWLTADNSSDMQSLVSTELIVNVVETPPPRRRKEEGLHTTSHPPIIDRVATEILL